MGGLGMVARNERGEVMGAAANYPIHVISPLLGEASCLFWAMRIAVDFGFRSLCFEMDCLQLYEW